MYPAGFRYIRARTLEEAAAAFRDCGDAQYLAGGQTLIPAMKLRLAQPAAVIDIGRIAGLNAIRADPQSVEIGAATTHADVAASPAVRRAIPALAELAETIGDPAVRHRGTLGGSVATNDPAADYPAALLALDATVRTTLRDVAAEDFFTGIYSTALSPGEIVTAVTFRVPARAAYIKFRNPASRFAMPGVFVSQSEGGVRVAVTGAGPRVFRAHAMEERLQRSFTPEALEGVAVPAAGLSADLHASAEYRAHLIAVLARRAVRQALERT